MAGNKINTKKKDDKSKSSRNADSAVEENEDNIDFSLLRKPILTSITGFAQARKIFDLATEELKGLLSNECDLLYECKVCRNMFRSLANFISHKRVYCKEQFNSSVHGHFVKETNVMNEVLKIKKVEESYQESLTEKNITDNADEDEESRIPITKDLTSILEKITNNTGVQQSELENKQLVFQKIPKSSVAVFQNVEVGNTKTDTMKAQVDELNVILSQENAVLQSDGTFKVQSHNKVDETDNVIQISDDDENEEADVLKCKICGLQFSTLKTLKFHIKYKHLENRLVYPCPDCLDIFSTSWSVYRHLFKVHRKTAAQIRRLREAIQSKAFRMNNPPTYYEKRKTVPKPAPTQKITEEERLYKENQAWLEELDGESEGRRCGGCGRTFERRAALAAHTNTCARRHGRRIQIQIRKDYHKEPSNPYLALAAGAAPEPAPSPADTKLNAEDVQMADKVQADRDIKEENDDEPPEAETPTPDDKKQETEEMETDEPIIQNHKPKFYDSSMINKLPFAQQVEKNNLNAFRQKIQSDVDLFKLLCKKCIVKYDKLSDFLDHMSSHYKWVRYACKLCNFKHFNFDKLPEHVKVVHKLKGNTEFYYSTVKAIDGTEALELSGTVDEANDTSPKSRRPSRCSSDSSRLSDDSSSSSTRPEIGSRKRKSNLYKANAKKKRETLVADDNDQKEDDILLVEDSTSVTKIFEENSSDFDEVEEKSSKRRNVQKLHSSSVASRRPVRKKTKPKNADFEYDLSNLLKMEAQGYRDSQTVFTKVVPSKRKTQELQSNYDILNKDCCGAMITLSRKSVENAQGHMKTVSCPVFKTSKDTRLSNFFARPMIPKIIRTDKISPKKVETDELNNFSSPSKVAEPSSSLISIVGSSKDNKNEVNELESDSSETITQTSSGIIKKPKVYNQAKTIDSILNNLSKDIKYRSVSSSEKVKKIAVDNDKTSTQPSVSIVKKPKDNNQARTIDTIVKDFKDVKDKSVSSSETKIKNTLDNDKTSTQATVSIVKELKDNIQAQTMDTISNDFHKDVKDKSVLSSEKDKKIIMENDKISTQSNSGIVQKTKSNNQDETIDTILNDFDKNIRDKSVSSSEKNEIISLENDKTLTQKSLSNDKKPKDIIQTKATDTILNDSDKDITDGSVSSSEKDKKITSETDEAIKKSATVTEKVAGDATCLSIPDSNSGNIKPNLNMIPIKFRRQSMEVIKNPLIKKNITDFTKAGMKTKILVIKPINRNTDGIKNLNGPLKFQTITLKDPSKSSATNEEKKSDQVVVVQVPKVDCGISRSIPTNSNVNNRISSVTSEPTTSNIESEKCENFGLSNQEQTPDNDDKTIDSHKNVNSKPLEKNSKENINQKDQANSESDHVISESVNEVNELVMDSNKIFSQDS